LAIFKAKKNILLLLKHTSLLLNRIPIRRIHVTFCFPPKMVIAVSMYLTSRCSIKFSSLTYIIFRGPNEATHELIISVLNVKRGR